ncbi:hypothetical protein [Silvibacterium acidisoli]|uniref:hypothetical protein n=1 Tax=Acidobacteriaceae bacterium ZG23-2 TaxID=2883246 RepID=UPI00406C251D
MLVDLVIDTNIFLHAQNKQEKRQKSCEALVALFKDSSCKICVDEGFDLDESRNRSIIGQEYTKHLRIGSLGYALVEYLARSGRISFVSTRVSVQVSRHIRQVTKGPDRTYVRVAHNSNEKTLASHDFTDISSAIRQRLRDAIDVSVLDSSEIIELLKKA